MDAREKLVELLDDMQRNKAYPMAASVLADIIRRPRERSNQGKIY